VSPPAELVLISRQDCELCEQMLTDLEQLGRRVSLPPVRITDVDSDPQLQRRHGLHVPVLLLEGSVVCRHRLDARELCRLLRPIPAAGP
jgi:hypothetical protein